MTEARPPRSAEQTARLLLSNAFRYDTWECTTARKEVLRAGGEATTVQLAFHTIEKQDLPPTEPRIDAINLSLFDPERGAFVGAAYKCDRRSLQTPLVVQAMPKQLLVVETLVRDTRHDAPLEQMRVTHWGACAIEKLGQPSLIELRPGTGQLLLLDRALWPPVSTTTNTAVASVAYKCRVDKDPALAQLMRELVPPGVFVSEAFTRATPTQGGSSFRLVINAIELSGTSRESMEGLTDPDADWAVAAVAHNGYQQLGQGAEVPLVLDDGRGSRRSTSTPNSTSSYTSSSYGYSYDSSSSSSRSSRSGSHRNSRSAGAHTSSAEAKNMDKDEKQKEDTGLTLRSELPLEMRGLPIHAATSLVLAIRRRTPESPVFKVVGFCVLPLCMLPMRNRDIRVENLPALRGPFSCEDARMLMVDSASPYGRVPIAVTLTVEYHDLVVPAAVDADATGTATAVGGDATPGAAEGRRGSTSAARDGRPVGSDSLPPSSPHSSLSGGVEGSGDGPRSARQPLSSAAAAGVGDDVGAQGSVPQPGPIGLAVLSTAESGAPDAGGDSGAAASGTIPDVFQSRQQQQQQQGARSLLGEELAAGGSGDGIFRLLCTIMEELQRVRETQDVILRQTAGLCGRDPLQTVSPEMMERFGQQLADTPIDLVDLSPRPLAISWAARRAITDDVQPILHPTRGTILDGNTPAPPGALPASLFGIRLEGLTLDAAVAMPADVCVMFSFGPLACQRVGPMRASSVHTSADGTAQSYKLYDDDGRGGMVWCEPTETLTNAAMAKFKENGGNATVYVHVYDALTMFYVATASLPLSVFHRPFNLEAAVTQMDAALQRDFAMTEHTIPVKIFPVMRNAGQLHLSVFCVGMPGPGAGGAPLKSAVMRTPAEDEREDASAYGGRSVVVAKRLLHTEGLGAGPASRLGSSGAIGKASSPTNRDGSVDTPRGERAMAGAAREEISTGVESGTPTTTDAPLHWQRAAFIKQQLAGQEGNAVLLPGVPDAHVHAAQQEAELEYQLRYAEKLRSEAKARAIAAALTSRMTVHHQVTAVAYRPETVRTPFQNPHVVPMQFFVEVPAAADQAVCAPPAGRASFYLGPRERTEVPLVVRVYPGKSSRLRIGDTRTVCARISSEKREVIRYITMEISLVAPLVDRRYEVFGPAGSAVSKRVVSRLFSPASFPVTADQASLLRRMRDLCAYAATSSTSGRTQVETNAVLDPITQTYVTAWEEATIRTTVPSELGRQRIEYVTLFFDADMTRVYETWELCIFACECLTTREVAWGQTTALGLPATGTEDMYCDSVGTTVELAGSSYVLSIKPKEVGTLRMLVHTLMDDGNLRKTLMTVPVVHPMPSFTQTIEVSLEEAARGPVFRRLTFTHHGNMEEVFQVHHNYRYQLKISPQKFALAPGDSQFITLQMGSLLLPPGQLEGRWPMWIFINDARDKTVESYLLQVILRAHAVVALPGT